MKEYILLVSMTIMVCVVVNLMVPSPKYAGIVKIVCGLFVVNTLISPIRSIFKTGTFNLEINSFVADGEFESGAQLAKKNFDEILASKRAEILSAEVTADLKKLWSDSISAEVIGKEVRVNNADDKDFDDIKKYLKDRYGLVAVFG